MILRQIFEHLTDLLKQIKNGAFLHSSKVKKFSLFFVANKEKDVSDDNKNKPTQEERITFQHHETAVIRLNYCPSRQDSLLITVVPENFVSNHFEICFGHLSIKPQSRIFSKLVEEQYPGLRH